MKFSYFNLMARGEGIRMALVHSKTDFEDNRVEFADWPTLKATIPSGQMPVLEVDGQVLNQSVPILRFIGAKNGYYNVSDPMAAYKADQTCATLDDHFNGDFYKLFMTETAATEEEMNVRVEKQNTLCVLLEAQLGGNKFFGGEKPSIADFYAYGTFFGAFAFNAGGSPVQEHVYKALRGAMSAFPKLEAWCAETMATELKDYLATKPNTAL